MAESTPLITDAELLALGLPGDALSAVDMSVRDAHRLTASDFALSHVKKRHKLPLLSWGSDLRRATADIAARSIMGTRGFDPSSKSGEEIAARSDAAIEWLRDVAKGIVEPVDIVDSSVDVDEEAPLTISDESAGWSWPTSLTGDDC